MKKMIIYLIMKLLVGYYVIIKKEWIKDQEKLFLGIDIGIVIIYLIIAYKIGLIILLELIMLNLIFVIIFLIYKMLNYIEMNSKEIIERIKKRISEKNQKKIKEFLLKPVVNKIIYYFVWMLPWNVGYWIYFIIMEHGWYLRVWINSTRDIILWKVFKWDSRMFFYQINIGWSFGKKYEIKKYLVIKIQAMIFRIMYLIYKIREGILKTSIKKYIWIRIIVYMYLSMFYLYILMEIQMLNRFLLYIIIIIELLFFYFAQEIIEYYEKDYIKVLNEKGRLTEENIWLLNFIKYPFIDAYKYKWVKNQFIWDLTLSNSITLKMLYKYILYVNKNTKGYFDREMNIMTRIYREKLEERKSILWDVLPRTRYVIISLKNEGFYRTEISESPIDYAWQKTANINLVNNKALYLSYYEKTYNNISLLMLVWYLRINKSYIYTNILHNIIVRNLPKLKKLHHFDTYMRLQCSMMDIFITSYIHKYNKSLMAGNIMFLQFFNKSQNYFNEEAFFYHFLENVINDHALRELKIGEKIEGLKNYKRMFKIMGRMMLYEEDAVIWNENLQEILDEYEKIIKNDEEVKKIYNEEYYHVINNMNSSFFYMPNIKETLKSHVANGYIKIENEEEVLAQYDYILYTWMLGSQGKCIEVKEMFFEKEKIEKIEDVLYMIYHYQIKFYKMLSEDKFYEEGMGTKVSFTDELDIKNIEDYKDLREW